MLLHFHCVVRCCGALCPTRLACLGFHHHSPSDFLSDMLYICYVTVLPPSAVMSAWSRSVGRWWARRLPLSFPALKLSKRCTWHDREISLTGGPQPRTPAELRLEEELALLLWHFFFEQYDRCHHLPKCHIQDLFATLNADKNSAHYLIVL